MLSGQRAFQGKSSADAMAAILREEVPAFAPENPVPPVLDRVVRHCLEKEPADRFQSMQDVVFDIESLSSICVVDLQGNRRVLSDGWGDLTGLAWSPDGKEIWFTGSRDSGAGHLFGISLNGRERLIVKAPGDMVLYDVAADGRVLLSTMNWRSELYGAVHRQAEQELTWFDFSNLNYLTDDGSLLLFNEALVEGLK